MAFRAFQASRVLSKKLPGWRISFTENVGFNLISFFEGFVIVTGINLGAPGWLGAVIAVFGLTVGIWSINVVKSKIARTE
jgi:hypothetical protein